MAAAIVGVGPVAVNQFDRAGGVGPGSNVIIQGATSGLGATTAMLARHLGATVVVSSRHEGKRARLRELGFEHVFDAADPAFTAQAREAFGGDGAHVVVDNLGEAAVWEHGFEALRPGGAVVSSGAFLGHTVSLNLLKTYSMGYRIIGVRTGTLEAVDRIWREAEKGFRTIVDATFPMSAAPAAHRYVEEAGNVGRVVLTR
jgi:NADPH:quinone reductase-like Zn-dependent oxidoreductase